MTLKRAVCVFTVLLSLAAQANSWSPVQKIGVPAFYPLSQIEPGQVTTNGGRILNGDKTIKLIVVDFNSAAINPTDYRQWYNTLHSVPSVPILVLGYVYTNTARRAGGSLTAPGDFNWVLGPVGPNYDCRPATQTNCTTVADWYGTFNGAIDGIFLDVGPYLDSKTPTECDQAHYYGGSAAACSFVNGLYQAITSAHSGPCSGHACVMLNASQFPNNWVLGASDYATIWERPYDGSANARCPGSSADGQNYVYNFIPGGASQNPTNWYFDSTNAARSEHLVYSEDGSHLNSIVCAGRNRGAPMMYVHHQDCAVYSGLPGYFETEVSTI